MSLSFRNQSTDLQSKSMEWFLYDTDLRHKRVKLNCSQNFSFVKTHYKYLVRIHVKIFTMSPNDQWCLIKYLYIEPIGAVIIIPLIKINKWIYDNNSDSNNYDHDNNNDNNNTDNNNDLIETSKLWDRQRVLKNNKAKLSSGISNLTCERRPGRGDQTWYLKNMYLWDDVP